MDRRAALRIETEQLSWRLASWRRHHRPPTPLPTRLWQKVVQLAARQGVTRTARALGVSTVELKRAVEQLDAAPNFAVADAAALASLFSELGITVTEPAGCAPVGNNDQGELYVEIDSPCGSKIRIQTRNVSPQRLADVVRGLTSQE